MDQGRGRTCQTDGKIGAHGHEQEQGCHIKRWGMSIVVGAHCGWIAPDVM